MILNNIDSLIQITESLKDELIHKAIGFGLKHLPNKLVKGALSIPRPTLGLVDHIHTKTLPKAITLSEKYNKHGLADTLKEHQKTLSDGLSKIDTPKIKEALDSDGVKSFKHHINHVTKHAQKKYANDYAEISKQNPSLTAKEVMSEANKKMQSHIADGITSLKTKPIEVVRRDLTKTEKGTIYGTGALTAYNTLKPNDNK